jgi:hypothetical protein
MKLIKYFLIFILLCGFSFALVQCTKESIEVKDNQALELRNTNCSPNLEPGCNDNYVILEQIQLPGYPGCDFLINYRYQKCNLSNGLVRFNIGDVVIAKHNCKKFWDDLNAAIANGTVEQFWIGINKLLYKYVTEKLIKTVNPEQVLALAVNYHIAACQKMCTEERRDDPDGPYIAYYIHCGDKCCALYTYYTVVNGEWTLLTKTLVPAQDACVPTSETCSTRVSTDCIVQSGSLDFLP